MLKNVDRTSGDDLIRDISDLELLKEATPLPHSENGTGEHGIFCRTAASWVWFSGQAVSHYVPSQRYSIDHQRRYARYPLSNHRFIAYEQGIPRLHVLCLLFQ